jgi:hypothetical protein
LHTCSRWIGRFSTPRSSISLLTLFPVPVFDRCPGGPRGSRGLPFGLSSISLTARTVRATRAKDSPVAMIRSLHKKTSEDERPSEEQAAMKLVTLELSTNPSSRASGEMSELGRSLFINLRYQMVQHNNLVMAQKIKNNKDTYWHKTYPSLKASAKACLSVISETPRAVLESPSHLHLSKTSALMRTSTSSRGLPFKFETSETLRLIADIVLHSIVIALRMRHLVWLNFGFLFERASDRDDWFRVES